MSPPTAAEDDLSRLRLGQPPVSDTLLEALTAGQAAWLDFVVTHYLERYIRGGGSKVKLLLGPPGSGKTHALRYLLLRARQQGYLTAYVDVREIKLQQFQTLYGAIVARLNLDELIARFAALLIADLGYQPEDVQAERSFYQWAVRERERPPEVLKRELNEALERRWNECGVVGPFRVAITHLVLRALGVLPGEPSQVRTIKRWLQAEPLRISETKGYHLFQRIDRYNARPMLMSLLHLARLLGYGGLVAGLDNLDTLLDRHPESRRRRYTRAARDDAYESMRQLIDELDDLGGAMVLFAGRSELLDDEKDGLKSYDALWLRLQHEIVSPQFNKFTDLVDMAAVLAAWDPAVVEHLPAHWFEVLQAAGLVAADGAADRRSPLLSHRWMAARSDLRALVIDTVAQLARPPDRIDPLTHLQCPELNVQGPDSTAAQIVPCRPHFEP